MQLLQYHLRCPAAKDKSITHTAVAPSNLDAAITMRSAQTEVQNTRRSEIAAPKPDLDAKAKKKDFEALFKRMFQRKITNTKIEKNLLTNHYRNLDAAIPIRFTMSSCKRQKMTKSITHAAAAPSNLDARGQHESLYAHGNRTRQQSCSHYTAICNQRVKKRKELRTHEQPLLAEHRGGTNSTSKRSKPHPPHTRGTFHRRLQPHMEKHKVSCSSFPPNRSLMQHSCSRYTAFCSITWPTRNSLRTWQQNTTTIMQPLHCNL